MKKWILVGMTLVFLAATVISLVNPEIASQVKTYGQEEEIRAETLQAEQDVLVVGEEDIRTGFLDVITGYQPGTAGSSLKRAVAAMHVLDFCRIHYLAGTDKEKFTENLLSAWNELPDTEKELFPELFASVSGQIEEDLQNSDALSGLYDDAGILEEMQELLQEENLRSSWVVLKECAGALK